MAAIFTRRWIMAHPRTVARAIIFIAFIFIFLILVQTHSFFTFTSGFNSEIQLSHQELDQRVRIAFSEKIHEKSEPIQINKVLGSISAISELLQPYHNQPPFHIEEYLLCPLISPLLGNNFSYYSIKYSLICIFLAKLFILIFNIIHPC